MRGTLGHAAANASRTEAAAFAGERNDAAPSAIATTEVREAVGKNAATEISTKLALDEYGEARSIGIVSQGTQTPQYGKMSDPRLNRGEFVFAALRTMLPPAIATLPSER